MKTMKMNKKIIALTAILIGMMGWAGDSAPFLLDTIEPLVEAGEEVSFNYNSFWVGGDSSAEIVISADETEIKRMTGEGEFVWSPTTMGKHTLTYTTYINGVAQEEVYTATVFKDWKYTVDNGEATIIGTTQTSGDVVIPSEIDGYPVVAIGANAFDGCSSLTEITIPDSVYSIGANAFANCTGLKKVSMPFPLKAQVETGDIFVGCSDALEIVYRTAEITDIVAKQRYPWNGKVDIKFEVIGNVNAGLSSENPAELIVTAKDIVTGEEWIAKTLTGDTGTNEGEHHVVWDMKADGLSFYSQNIKFKVGYSTKHRKYCVIDLSAGKDATNYLVSYL